MSTKKIVAGLALALALVAGARGTANAQEAGGVPIREVVVQMASRIIRMNPSSPELVESMRTLILRVSEMDPEQMGITTDRTDPYRTDDRYRTDPYRTDDRYRTDSRYTTDSRYSTATRGASAMQHRRMSGADMGPIYTIYTMLLEYHKNYGSRETRQVFLDIVNDLVGQLRTREEAEAVDDEDPVPGDYDTEEFF